MREGPEVEGRDAGEGERRTLGRGMRAETDDEATRWRLGLGWRVASPHLQRAQNLLKCGAREKHRVERADRSHGRGARVVRQQSALAEIGVFAQAHQFVLVARVALVLRDDGLAVRDDKHALLTCSGGGGARNHEVSRLTLVAS